MYLKQVAMKALALPAIYQPTEPSAVPGILATKPSAVPGILVTKPSAVPGILATKPLAVLGIDKATEASAIQFRTGNELCGKDSYYIPDNQCSSLPGKWLYVAGITEDCRAFIYKNKDCTGGEMQLRDVDGCWSIEDYYSIKAFCH
ncbi:hypothetical protein FCULG_00001900 [Fusarium culmorum]|uniref:Uncharacterized protein n=1 Tax=Fusarium culmorum TaxID=5516 RepID=A0A2T4GL43_FUSCU|nr:hypothetical protein FCULG_00001900 [Fusarium culmorum]